MALKFSIRKGFFDVPRVRRAIGEANFEALSKAGMDVRDAAKRAIGQRAPARTNRWRRTQRQNRPVEFLGGLYKDITPIGSGKPRAPGQPAKSWSPKRFLYRDIRYYYDFATRSVVIGPERAPWLNQLHEFGGRLSLTAYRIGVRAAYIAAQRRRKGKPIHRLTNGELDVGAVIWTHRGFRGGKNWDRTSITRQARYPARPYMGSAAVERVLKGKIALRFKDTIRRAS